jgi:hypothetical protein
MTNNLEFIPVSKEAKLIVPKPKPASEYLPDWYKKLTPEKDPTFNSPGKVANRSIKHCMPLLDAYSHGYIQESWTDIYIEVVGDQLRYHFAQETPKIMDHRNHDTKFSVSSIYYPQEFVWREQWIPKCPPGYSMLYTTPLNHFDLPFTTLSAVIDSDKYYHESTGQNPFYIYNGFTGMIPAGTPMFQMIPIKRSDWESKELDYDGDVNLQRQALLRKHMYRGYQKLFWQRKKFK